MNSINDTENASIIMNIFKDAAISLVKKVSENLRYSFKENIVQDKITIIFEVIYGKNPIYEVKIEKAKNNSEKIPNISRYKKLNNNGVNPYKNLKFTDENFMLGNIYDRLIKFPYKEIVCYEKVGIIIKNPMNIEGIYNINITYKGE